MGKYSEYLLLGKEEQLSEADKIKVSSVFQSDDVKSWMSVGLNKGDVVQLKSGGPRMTIMQLKNAEGKDQSDFFKEADFVERKNGIIGLRRWLSTQKSDFIALCMWFNEKGETVTQSFPIILLAKV